jgi:hypothetical protein
LEREINRGFFVFPVDITCHYCYNTFIQTYFGKHYQCSVVLIGAEGSWIADSFRQTLPLPAGADSGFYAELLTHIDVSNNQGLMLLAAIMNDVIVAAGREERPATPLETFPDWLRYKRTHEIQDAKPQDIQNPGI